MSLGILRNCISTGLIEWTAKICTMKEQRRTGLMWSKPFLLIFSQWCKKHLFSNWTSLQGVT